MMRAIVKPFYMSMFSKINDDVTVYHEAKWEPVIPKLFRDADKCWDYCVAISKTGSRDNMYSMVRFSILGTSIPRGPIRGEVDPMKDDEENSGGDQL